MTYNEKKSLYESIMKDVAKIVKSKLNEANTLGKSWTADFTYDNIAHLMFGVSEYELEKDEYREVRAQMRETIDFISSNKDKLKNMKVSVTIRRRLGEIEFKNITEENIIEFTEFFVTILNNAGEAYMSDFEDCIDYYDISETLEDNNPELYDQFEKIVNDSLFN